MDVGLFVAGVIALMVVLGVINAFVRGSPRGPDKDSDGEPDEPNGPAKDL
jgi:hypothetical protein